MIHWVDCYGEAIEWDLHERHLDLLDFFRGKHSWRKLHNLIGRLPRASAFMQAQMDDPQVAEWVLAQPEQRGPSRPAMQEYTPEIAALFDICDRLGDVMTAVIVAAGGKAPTIRPLPRPVTGVDRARAALAQQKHLSLVDEVKAAQDRYEANRSSGLAVEAG